MIDEASPTPHHTRPFIFLRLHIVEISIDYPMCKGFGFLLSNHKSLSNIEC